mmetsp:Transcript_2543/g.3935  ORF Transcript_2543/g.3935 Transcript_2543/m.3935 type:complete len:83 (-) Transcript_2543:13-261(-)
MVDWVDPLQTLTDNVDYQVRCDLKTDQTVRGRLKSCDNYMNMVLLNATVIDPAEHSETTVKEMAIRGTAIRAVKLNQAASAR